LLQKAKNDFGAIDFFRVKLFKYVETLDLVTGIEDIKSKHTLNMGCGKTSTFFTRQFNLWRRV